MKKRSLRTGKYIAYLLRHNPENLDMNKKGWVDVKDLLKKCKIPMEELEEIVATDNKQRYNFNDNKTKIRANQGHSIDWVEVDMDEVEPPDILYHGTSSRFLEKIYENGLNKMSRQHVHLSDDIPTATNVGQRHGDNTVIIEIDTKSMYEDGIIFYLSANSVWLVDHVDPKYFIDTIYI